MIQKKKNEVDEKMEQKVKHNRNKNNISNHNINNDNNKQSVEEINNELSQNEDNFILKNKFKIDNISYENKNNNYLKIENKFMIPSKKTRNQIKLIN